MSISTSCRGSMSGQQGRRDSSDGWRLPVVEFEPLWLVLLEESLEPESAIAPTAAARRGTDLGVGGAWIGALPGGDGVGDPAVVFAGNLLAPTGPRESAAAARSGAS